jgi:thioredoxin 1
MPTMEVDELDFQEVLEEEFQKGQIVILKFVTEYCDACMALGFELEEIEEKYENVSILEIDCSDSEQLAHEYGVIEVPKMIIYENRDSILWNKKGIVLAQDIENIIKS